MFDKESRKKRKIEDLKVSNAKRSKTEESQLLVGAQVAVKVDKDWILAVILNPNPVKGKVEIEVILNLMV